MRGNGTSYRSLRSHDGARDITLCRTDALFRSCSPSRSSGTVRIMIFQADYERKLCVCGRSACYSTSDRAIDISATSARRGLKLSTGGKFCSIHCSIACCLFEQCLRSNMLVL